MNLDKAKFFIVSPAWVGDLVMSQVLLKLLKQQQPNSLIDVLAPEWGKALLTRMPEVNRVYTMPLSHGQFALKQRWQLGRSLRAEKYTQAFVLPNSWKSALIPFAARVPRRTGWRGEMRWFLLNDVRYLDKIALPLMIQRFAKLCFTATASLPTDLPKPRLIVNSEAVASVLAKFDLQLTQPILALCPGAEYGPAKRWPAAYYAAVAKQKIAAGWNVWIFGAVKDQTIATEIQQLTDNQCVDLTGRTNLGEAVDLMAQANMVVTNDSGLMHIAAALDRPLVAIYGSSSPRFTPPLSEKVEIVSLGLSCSPCFERVCPLGHFKCLQDLQPARVLEAIDRIL